MYQEDSPCQVDFDNLSFGVVEDDAKSCIVAPNKRQKKANAKFFKQEYIELKSRDDVSEKYSLYNERNLDFLHETNPDTQRPVIDFNINELEAEYDYDTDQEQISRAKIMLTHENL